MVPTWVGHCDDGLSSESDEGVCVPTKTYPLEEDGPDRVELSWGRKFKNFTIKLDGQQLNPEPYDLQSLRAGQQVDLRDGTKLRVAFQRGSTGGLSVTRDGKPLPGSPSHPVSKAKGASVLMFVIAGFNALFLALLFTREDVPSLALATTGAWIAVFVVLGLFVRRGSLGALWAGIALFGLDTVTRSCSRATSTSAGSSSAQSCSSAYGSPSPR